MLWYKQPAQIWSEALPLGNGRLGAMAYGNTDREIITLNEDTLWSGRPVFREMPGAAEAFRKARELVYAGKNDEAQLLLEEQVSSRSTEHYLPLGNIVLETGHGEVTDYRRSLSLQEAVSCVSYKYEGVSYSREMFISYPSQTFEMKLDCDTPGSLCFRVSLESLLKSEVSISGNQILMQGICPGTDIERGKNQSTATYFYSEDPEQQGMSFAAGLKLETVGGKVYSEGAFLCAEGCDSARITLAARTNFQGWDKAPAGDGHLQMVEKDLSGTTSYEILRENHVADYKALYGTCSFSLFAPESDLPTDERLFRHEQGQQDNGLYELLFAVGRYLTIASSREGSQATNLQGIWNDRLNPPWSCNYTVNINTQMNYWPTVRINLASCFEPMTRFVKEICESGKRTAREFFGARGTVCNHNSDLWRLTTPVGNGQVNYCAQFAVWPLGAGWLANNIADFYAYTLDEQYLKETAYPVVREVCQFFVDVLTPDEDGKLIFAPTMSPENAFIFKDKMCAISKSAAMTQSIIRDMFVRCLEFAQKLGHEDELVAEVREKLGKLKNVEIGEDGRILEWDQAFRERQLTHRHLSHLYFLYPLRGASDDLRKAARESLEVRGDEASGWSLSWKVSMWAQLKDAQRAKKLLDMQLRPRTLNEQMSVSGGGTYISMLCCHPPFQIDGNFGILSGILEMLLSPEGEPLPALPAEWPDGKLTGVRLLGNRVADMEWHAGKVTKLDIRAYTAC